MIQLDAIFRSYIGDIRIDLTLDPHKNYILRGENGSGKSSILNWLKINQGSFAPSQFSFMSQAPLSPLKRLRPKDYFDYLQDRFPNRFIIPALGLGPLQDKMNNSVKELSGGENQWLKLLICLGLKADFYFLDEPYSFLDFSYRKKLKSHLMQKPGHLWVDHQITTSDLQVIEAQNITQFLKIEKQSSSSYQLRFLEISEIWSEVNI